jgi:hypothetical protein
LLGDNGDVLHVRPFLWWLDGLGVFTMPQRKAVCSFILGSYLDVFPADALSSTFPLMTGFGVVAVVLIVLSRGRLDYGRLLEARSAPRVR